MRIRLSLYHTATIGAAQQASWSSVLLLYILGWQIGRAVHGRSARIGLVSYSTVTSSSDAWSHRPWKVCPGWVAPCNASLRPLSRVAFVER